MSAALARGVERLAAPRARAAVAAALVAEHRQVAPVTLLDADAWTCATLVEDADGWRGAMVAAGGRRTSARTFTAIDAAGAVVATFPADAAAARALGIAAGVAAPRLAREGPVRMALLGAGAVGRAAVEELRLALDVERVAVHDPDAAAARAAADLGRPAADAASAVRDATVIVTATNARDPVLRADWVAPGATIIALGADRVGRRELDYRLVEGASFVACDAVPVARAIADDLRGCVEEGHLDWQEVTPLGAVLSGQADARVAADDLVVVKLIDATPLVLALARAALGA